MFEFTSGTRSEQGCLMRAALMLSRSEIKRRGASLLLLAALVAVTGGVTLTAAAGARRTSSSYDRFIATTKNQDVVVFADDARPADVARLRALPGVEALGYARQMTIVRPSGEFVGVGGALDDVVFRDVDRLRIVEGRAVRPGATDEVVVGEPLARASNLHIGDALDLRSFTPAQVAHFGRGDLPVPAGPRLRLRVVG